MYGPSQPYINWISFWYQPSSYVKVCYGKTSGETSKVFLYHLIYFTVSFYEDTGEKFLSRLSTKKSCASSQQLAYPELLEPVNLRTVFLSLPWPVMKLRATFAALMSSNWFTQYLVWYCPCLTFLDSGFPILPFCKFCSVSSLSQISWERRQRDMYIHTYFCVSPKVINTHPSYCLWESQGLDDSRWIPEKFV